ncbi:MAG TPA: nucleoside triphosphate pyrophosphohydrolase [Salinivirga sp.]|uniref:nucleoside triphosphate pyrophosphohydrolase n=1 Tax=Salinivirga sp. TaxID=1970192 RepID=UPI002B48DD9D|nr:nucleoside triphosphate pyrophosphohydrolase [Salinivirga sp.]HKK60201.1 nucleoside triphosphate pyrophosphohydrolase [Salinivirga sp.]
MQQEGNLQTLDTFKKLLDIMNDLRAQCPWDKKQTLESLRNLTIEETYELADAILERDGDEIKKELGDILLHIVFYSKIGAENDWFTINDVMESLNQKLIYRHPHIYGDTKAQSATEVEENWEALKLKEKGRKKRVLEGVPKSLPALVKANRIQQKVRGVGFDWTEREQVWGKVDEELREVKDEIAQKNSHEDIEAEFGDLFFSLINAARLYDIDPETALERTNKKFMQRFNYLESQTLQKGKDLHKMSLEEMDVIWEEAKQFDKKNH